MSDSLFVAFPVNSGTLPGGRKPHVHLTGADGRPLCGTQTQVRRSAARADWNWLHSAFRPAVCQTCYKAAVLHLRPSATYWYLSPFNGDRHEFPTLRKAVESTRREHGSSHIYKSGPGDAGGPVKTVQGLDPLP